MKSVIYTFVGVTFFAFALSGVPVLDAEADWEQSTTLQELQASQEGSERREQIARTLCHEARGPNSEARWLEDGSLVCTLPRPLDMAMGDTPSSAP